MNNSVSTICGIIGNPVKHSLSPAMHNAGYGELGLDFRYEAWEVEDVASAVQKMRHEGIRGYSVTIPHKVEVMKYLDEIDEAARKIGAVNTVVNDGGFLKGYNTDWDGCVEAIDEVVRIECKKVVIVGAGGAARAVVFGMKNELCRELVILNRSVNRARILAEEVGAGYGRLDEIEKYNGADILINTTSVGMVPNVDECPVPDVVLRSDMVVHDIVYQPLETRLIKLARSAGARVVTGEKMLLYQGVKQFELFTGEKAPVGVMREALEQALSV